jgi:hypothetical protein
MRGQAMQRIIERLKYIGVPLSTYNAVDIFAREGDWQTAAYAPFIGSVEAWEIDPSFITALQNNLPYARVRCVDSYEEMKKTEHAHKYQFVVIDNPQNCFGVNREHCEHFDVFPVVFNMFSDHGYCIFNLNRQPFGFEKFPDWQQKRIGFYGREDVSYIPLPFFEDFYIKLFTQHGFKVLSCRLESRGDYEHQDYLHYICLEWSR